MNDGFLIGEAAAIFGLQVDTLRYYDKIKLLSPSDRAENGYRLYSIPDVRRLRFILLCRKLNMPINDIRNLLDNGNLEQFVEQLQLRQNDINRQIRELKQISYLIDETAAFIKSNRVDEIDFSVQELPNRYYGLLAENVHFQTEAESITQLKPALLDFVKTGDTAELITNRLGQIIHLDSIDEDSNEPKRDFIYYSREFDKRANNLIPAGRYAVLRFREYLEEENQNLASDLLKWAEKNGETACNKIYVVMQIDTDFSGHFEDHVIELSVLLK